MPGTATAKATNSDGFKHTRPSCTRGIETCLARLEYLLGKMVLKFQAELQKGGASAKAIMLCPPV